MTEVAAPIRRRDAARTRERILLAAQEVFSTRDYTQARISDIAAEAGVNQALVVRYFGSKDQLFATALEAVLELSAIDDSGDRASFSKTVIQRLIGGDGGPRDPLPMVIHAVSDPVALAQARILMDTHIFRPLVAWMGPPDAEARAAEMLLLCAGFFTYNKLLPLEPLVGSMAPAARSWLETSLQAIMDRRDPGSPESK